MNLIRTCLVIAGLFCFALSASAAHSDCKDHSKFGEIDRAELEKGIKEKSIFVIDVNSKESYAKSHIPGAIHFEANKDKLAKALPADKDTQIVAYCGGPKCTAWQKAAEKACEMGYGNIRHFKPGISGWNKKS